MISFANFIFGFLWVIAAPVISILMSLSVVFLKTQELRWLGGDACAPELIRGVSYLISAATVSLRMW